MDCGLDTSNYIPYSFEEIRTKIKEKEEVFQTQYPETQIQGKLDEVR